MGSLAMGIMYFLSPVASLLIDRFGIRLTAFLGSIIAFAGMIISAFLLNHVSLP